MSVESTKWYRKNKGKVDAPITINVFEVVPMMDRVDRRVLTLHQLAELATNAPLNEQELQAVKDVVVTVNRYTEYRFTGDNTGLTQEEADKLGLQ